MPGNKTQIISDAVTAAVEAASKDNATELINAAFTTAAEAISKLEKGSCGPAVTKKWWFWLIIIFCAILVSSWVLAFRRMFSYKRVLDILLELAKEEGGHADQVRAFLLKQKGKTWSVEEYGKRVHIEGKIGEKRRMARREERLSRMEKGEAPELNPPSPVVD